MDFLRRRGSSEQEPPIRRDLSAARAAFDGNDAERSRRAHLLVARTGDAHAAANATTDTTSTSSLINGDGSSPNAVQTAQQADNASTDKRVSTAADASPVEPSPYVEPGHDFGETSVAKSAFGAGIDGAMAAVILFSLVYICDVPHASAVKLIISGVVGLNLAVVVREYVRLHAERSHFARERAREKWELENYPQGEEGEMVELYISRGVSRNDAETAISALSKYSDFFVDLMMTQELKMVMPDSAPRHNAFAAGIAFAFCGILPTLITLILHAYVIAPWFATPRIDRDTHARESGFITHHDVLAVVMLSCFTLLPLTSYLLPRKGWLPAATLLVIGLSTITGFVALLLPQWLQTSILQGVAV